MNRRVTIIDGGMGRELMRMGAPFRQPEWSALALTEGPEWVTQADANFINAGAEVILTNTYAIVPFHIGEERFAAEAAELAALARRLARQAADASPHPVRVAGVGDDWRDQLVGLGGVAGTLGRGRRGIEALAEQRGGAFDRRPGWF